MSGKQQPAGTSRRTFVAGAAAVAGALAGDWRANRAFAAANRRVIGANDRINIGFIGVGGMGGDHLNKTINYVKNGEMNLQVTAVCDVWEKRRNDARDKVADGCNPEVRAYADYRELLAAPDVDAVLIATPEHWHFRQAMDAIAAGKHIYMEKPFSRWLHEATELYNTVKDSGIILQTGNQASSHPKWRVAHQAIDGLGKPVWSQTSYTRNNPAGEWNYGIDESAGPDNLDWTAWLGSAPDRPFSHERYFRWRKFWDYSSGICGDLLPHRIYPVLITVGPELPTRVVATGGNIMPEIDAENNAEMREVPDTFNLLADFASGHNLFVAGSTINDRGVDTVVRCHMGDLLLEGGNIEVRPQRPFAEEIEMETIEVEKMPDDQDGHRRNWVDCMRSGEQPNCDPWLAYCGMVVCALGEISYRENRAVIFDPETMKIVDDAVTTVVPRG